MEEIREHDGGGFADNLGNNQDHPCQESNFHLGESSQMNPGAPSDWRPSARHECRSASRAKERFWLCRRKHNESPDAKSQMQSTSKRQDQLKGAHTNRSRRRGSRLLRAVRISRSQVLFVLVFLSAIFVQCSERKQQQQQQQRAPAELSSSSHAAVNDETLASQSSGASGTCFGGLQTFEKISMSSFESPPLEGSAASGAGTFGSGILVQQDDQALTSECINLCRSQSNCLSFVIDYNKFECKSYATTQQDLQQEFSSKFQRAANSNASDADSATGGYQSSNVNVQQLLPSASSNYFEKICLDGVANRNQFEEVCGAGRLWTIERVVDSFLDGFVEKEVTNVNSKDECGKLCIFESQFVCRSADYEHQSRLCRLSREDRRTQPQAMRHVPNSQRQYLENQCATPGPSSCVYETRHNLGIISMDALKFAQTSQDCQMKCNQEATFNCRSYSFHQQRCFLSGDDSVSLNSNLIKLPIKQGWTFGEKKCLVELCTKGIFSYEKITGFTLRSALSTSIDLMVPAPSAASSYYGSADEALAQQESRVTSTGGGGGGGGGGGSRAASIVSSMMSMMSGEPLLEAAGSLQSRFTRSSAHSSSSSSNLAITEHCRHSCDLGYLNCPAFTIDYRNNRCQRLDRNSQGRHLELMARDGFAYYEKICLRVPEIMSMCQDKYWIFERVLGYELAPRLYDKSLKFVQSRRDCEEYCLEERQFQCRSALYNDESSDCKLSRYDRRMALLEGAFYRNFNARISYLENNCIRDHAALSQQCSYEQVNDEPSYPTFTERIEMAPAPTQANHSSMLAASYANLPPPSAPSEPQSFKPAEQKHGSAYCEQLCNDNAKFECHSFGFYASTSQCFLSGDDSVSAAEAASTASSGFAYFERKCRPGSQPNYTLVAPEQRDPAHGQPLTTPPSAHTSPPGATTTTRANPYLQPPAREGAPTTPMSPLNEMTDAPGRFPLPPSASPTSAPSNGSQQQPLAPDVYKCGRDHSFVYQRISGFEPIGGYLTLLVKSDHQPGIVSECAEMCKRALECRAFVVDYANNQCYAMLENSSVGLLSLRQTLGKDYFEGFCLANHLLLTGQTSCRNKTWLIDKIVDQAVVGVQHQKVIPDSDRSQCRQSCLEERLFWCKSAMFDSATGECKLYSIERESVPQMRLLFTKGVDFFENQCQISSNTCPYDAIERDMTIITSTKSLQARSTFDCELACNQETSFNCRSYTYLDQYPSLPNLCLLSSDSRSTSQRGSVREQPRSLYAERNCFYRRARYPGPAAGGQTAHPVAGGDAYQAPARDPYGALAPPNRLSSSGGGGGGGGENEEGPEPNLEDVVPALGQAACEPHQFTFERTFGYDLKLASKERAPIAPTIGVAIGCQQECLRRAERCQAFVIDYALPYQSCFLLERQAGANKRLLARAHNSAYFEKVCLPRTGLLPVEAPQAAPLAMAHDHQPAPIGLANGDDISPSYSHEPWSPQPANQLPYHLQQQQLQQNYPSRSCPRLWSFERFVNHNFTAPVDKLLENSLTRAQCETACINEASFACRSATYDYTNKRCRLFKSTRRTMLSHFVDLEGGGGGAGSTAPAGSSQLANSHPGTAHVLGPQPGAADSIQGAASNALEQQAPRSRQLVASSAQQPQSAEPSSSTNNIDYLENTCAPEPSSCQYRQIYDQFSPYIDKVIHASSLADCQRQCDQERLFTCKSVNFDLSSRNCMLVNEDLLSLASRGSPSTGGGTQGSLLPKRNAVYSEKGNCEMISVQCNSQEMLVSINFDAPFRGRVMAKGNPDQCHLLGDGQTSLQFPIVFGPKCNSRQEGHNTFVNEVLIQQHPVIMTESDKTVRVMCAFEAPDQTITLKNPSSRDNKTGGIDVGATPEVGRTRHDKNQHFNSVVSNKASPPAVVLRILDQNGRDASMINLGDELTLRIQMQTEAGQPQNSALGIFARNLAARSSSGESLLLIDNDGCPVDHQVFPALEVDSKDGRSLYSNFKAFRFPSSGLVNFEVQIRFCPERCQPVECNRGQRTRSFGRRRRRRKRELPGSLGLPILQSVDEQRQATAAVAAASTGVSLLESLSTPMKPGKAFEYVRKLLLPQPEAAGDEQAAEPFTARPSAPATEFDSSQAPPEPTGIEGPQMQPPASDQEGSRPPPMAFSQPDPTSTIGAPPRSELGAGEAPQAEQPASSQATATGHSTNIVMHVDERVLPTIKGALEPGQTAAPAGDREPHQAPSHSHVPPYGQFPSLMSPELDPQMNRAVGLAAPPPPPQGATLGLDGLPADEASPQEFNFGGQRDAEPEAATSPPSTLAVDDSTLQSIYDQQQQPTKAQAGTEHMPNHRAISNKELPLHFSILVGENGNGVQGSLNPSAVGGGNQLIVMNSSSVDLDHIVIAGKNGAGDQRSDGGDFVEQGARHQRAGGAKHEQTPATLDVMTSNSVESEVKISAEQAQETSSSSAAAAAASQDCQLEAGRSKLRTIIWTGSVVIVLNVCLVVLSLVLYFKRVHLRQDSHTIVGSSSSDFGTHRSALDAACRRSHWPSVILKSKHSLGGPSGAPSMSGSTSISTHEHFFCKLNSPANKPLDQRHLDFNWLPNLSSSSAHSTISSLASGPMPRPSSSSRLNQTRPSLKSIPFDAHLSSLREANFDSGTPPRATEHKTVLDLTKATRAQDRQAPETDKYSARYTESLERDLDSDRF